MDFFLNMIKNWAARFTRIAASPLLWKDIRIFLRGWKSFGVLLFFLLILFVLVALNWAHVVDSWNPSAKNNSHLMRDLFFDLAQGHLIFFLFFTPFLAATTFFGEREQNTLELLLSSPVSSMHLVLAKLLAPIGFLTLLLIAGLPVLSFCLVAGGLSVQDVLGVYGLLFSTVLVYGCLGMFCSTFGSRIYQTMLITAFMTLLFAIVIPFHGAVWSLVDPRFMSYLNHMIEPNLSIQRINIFQRIVSPQTFTLWGSINHGMECVNPLYQLYLLIYPPTFPVFRDVMIYIGYSGLLCFFLIGGANYRVKRIAKQTVRPPAGRGNSVLSEKKKGTIWLRDLTSDDALASSSQWESPGNLLEKRIQWFARSSGLIRIGYASIIGSLCILPIASQDTSVLFFMFPLFLSLLITLPITATRISIEREQRTLDLLRTTLLPMWDYTRSKFHTCLRYSLIFALALYLPGMAARLSFGWLGGHRMSLNYKMIDTLLVLFYPLFLFCCIRFYTAMALFVSAAVRRTGRALVVIGLVVSCTMLIPLLFTSYFSFIPIDANNPWSEKPGILLEAKPLWAVFWQDVSRLSKWILVKGSFFFSPIIGILSLLPKSQAKIWIGNHESIGFPFNPVGKGQIPWEAYLFVVLQCALFWGLAKVLIQWTERTTEHLE
ncbi:MAG: ABC transporter permease subunit [Candidatus Omnitrophica bacterium]|nr:ABC transporter permease subunit [Candidatus Omnitrophota bacterium]